MLKLNRMTFKADSSGFSILEMAIVMVIVGTILGGLLVSFSSVEERNRRTDAVSTLEEIKEALYGFAQVNGRLPCPATAGSVGLADPAIAGACTRQHGFVPWSTLGLSGTINDDELLVDGWLSPYRYSVTTSNGAAFTTSISAITPLTNLAPDLEICDDAACGTTLFDSAPAVIYSLGADWDAFSSADEVENSGETTVAGYRMANDLRFVSTGYIEDTFDDLITWISPSILYTRMIAAGQLP
ncbi:MAG: hypothetical protein DHS20C12_03340 [Pseudohongiella sp.]|nr:MAG: hypothetical protein DHS20C12_03340 [Pseudohongiella sp.]